VVDDVARRRAAGETLSDEQILAAHPGLAASLAEELRKLALIRAARDRAEAAGSVSQMVTVAGAVSGDLSPMPTFPSRPLTPQDSSCVPRDAVPGYEIIREISRGGQAVVYQAVQKSTGRRVALKVMHDGPFAGAHDRARFDREVQILAALEHPNVVAVIDRGVTLSGSHFLAMEYVQGKPLDEWLTDYCGRRGGDFSDPSELLRLFMKVCDGVNAAHMRGVVHRDLKPSNIRVDDHGEPHVLDFGLARAGFGAVVESESPGRPQPVTITGHFIGSLPWASPEQAEGVSGRIDVRSDVYSLGVILYQMLTGGQFPYEVAGTMRDVLNNILNAEPTPPSQVIAARQAKEFAKGRRQRRRHSVTVNEQVEAVVLKALSKRREDRYASAGEFRHDVANYLAGRPTLAAGAKSRGRSRRFGSARWAGVVVMVVVCVAATAAWLGRRGGAGSERPGGGGAERQSPDAASASVAAAHAAAPTGRVIDLMPLLDPVGGAVKGTWARSGDDLVSSADTPATLQLPYRPTGEYDVFAEFSEADSLCLLLCKNGRRFMWSVGATDPQHGRFIGFSQVNGQDVFANPTGAKLTTNAGRHRTLVHVRDDVVRGYFDGRPMAEWLTDCSDMSLESEWDMPDPARLGIATVGKATRFHVLRVAEVPPRLPGPAAAVAEARPASGGVATTHPGDGAYELVRDGGGEPFATLIEAQAAARNGDTLQFRTTGWHRLRGIWLPSRGMTVRGAPGRRPRLVCIATLPAGRTFVESPGDLRIEGCDLSATDATLLGNLGRGKLELVHCRLTVTGEAAVLIARPGQDVRLENCLVQTADTRPALAVGQGVKLEMTNCVVTCGGPLFQFHPAGGQSVRLRDVTLHVPRLFDLDPTSGAAPVAFDVRGCLLVTEVLGRFHDKSESLKSALKWEGSRNLYVGPDAPVLPHGEHLANRTAGLAAWTALWGREEEGAQQADTVRFQWQDETSTTGASAADALGDPLRWILLPTSPGQTPGARHAGADVSKVAPLSPSRSN
jgi:serine/threonine protein kinase